MVVFQILNSSFRSNVPYLGKIDRRNLLGPFLKSIFGLKNPAFNITRADVRRAAEQYRSDGCVENSIHVTSNHSIAIPDHCRSDRRAQISASAIIELQYYSQR